MNTITTQIKNYLIQNDWCDAMMLLDDMVRLENEKTQNWFQSGSTLDLKNIAERFRNFSYHRQSLEPMPFENNVNALDASICAVLDGRV